MLMIAVVGNPKHNSLPACQLQRLHTLVGDTKHHIDSAQYSGAFWIDTLCVPLDKIARKQALSLIRKTFHEAACTVVLDREVEHLSKGLPGSEILWRLSLSDWARRLWTYEEFVVSENRVLVQCEDGLLNVAETMTNLTKDWHEDMVKYYKYNANDIPSMPDQMAQNLRYQWQNQGISPLSLFDRLSDHVSNLTTSRWEDEILCLASIMSVATSVLAILPAEDRLGKLLSVVQCLPANMLFGVGPRSKKPGFRWAPATFLMNHLFPYSVGMCGRYRMIPEFGQEIGFDVVLGGYNIVRWASRIRRDVTMKVLGSKPSLCFLHYYDKLEDPRAWWLEWTRGHCEVDIDPSQFMPETFPPGRLKLILLEENMLGPALLVHLLGTINGIERVKFIARIDVNKITDPDKSWDQVSVDWRRGEVVHAMPIATTHRWFIV